ncbi:MAG: hypothetical protein AAF597_11790 [Bacteroidota bacterium]
MTVYFVIAVASTIIFYIGKEVLGAFQHPTDEELIDYWSGRMEATDRKAYRRISEHLASCEECRDRFDEIRKRNAGPGADAPMIERKY